MRVGVSVSESGCNWALSSLTYANRRARKETSREAVMRSAYASSSSSSASASHPSEWLLAAPAHSSVTGYAVPYR